MAVTFRFAPDTASHNDFWEEASQAGLPENIECTYQHAYDVEIEVSPEQADLLVSLCESYGWSCQRSDVQDWDGPKWLGSANDWGRVNA